MNVCYGVFQFLELKFVAPILSFLDRLVAKKNLEVDDFFRDDDSFYL